MNDFVSPSFGTCLFPKTGGADVKATSFLNALKNMSPDALRAELTKLDARLARVEALHNAKMDEIKNWHMIKSPFKNRAMRKATEEFARDYQPLLDEKNAVLVEFEKRTGDFSAIAKKALLSTDPFASGPVRSDRTARKEQQAKDSFRDLKGFATLAGYEKEKHFLNDDIISAIKLEQAGEKVDVPGSILFFGPQGNGKSSFAKAFAYESGARVVNLRFPLKEYQEGFYVAFLKKIYFEAEKAKKHFEAEGATNNQRTILIIDEFDGLADKNSNVQPQLQEFLEKCSNDYHCTIFATTNYPENIKLSMKNDAVFPYRVGMDPATAEDKAKLLEFYMAPRAREIIDYKKIVEELLKIENLNHGFYSNARLRRIALGATPSEGGILANLKILPPDISQEQYNVYKSQVAQLSKGKNVL